MINPIIKSTVFIFGMMGGDLTFLGIGKGGTCPSDEYG